MGQSKGWKHEPRKQTEIQSMKKIQLRHGMIFKTISNEEYK